MTLSRRQFLQFSGITLLSSTPAFPKANLLALTESETLYGRALDCLTVYAQPNPGAKVVRKLWPDSIIRLTDSKPDWYQTGQGFVRRADVQPMRPYLPEQATPVLRPPFWAEVAAPVAALRQWCAADAPLVTRIGHGGVCHVIDALPDATRDGWWYGFASEDGGLLGWSQAVFWRSIHDARDPQGGLLVEIDRQQQQLAVTHGHQVLLQAAVSTDPALESGLNTLKHERIGTKLMLDEARHGVPWALRFDGGTISGVYWHNRFGAQTPGPAVQLPPLLAQWLYNTLVDGAPIRIR